MHIAHVVLTLSQARGFTFFPLLTPLPIQFIVPLLTPLPIQFIVLNYKTLEVLGFRGKLQTVHIYGLFGGATVC